MAPISLPEIKDVNERWILSCDGGGIRGIITLRCLETFESYVGVSCLQTFDMFAGTSTGAIIAGCLASGKLCVKELIGLYVNRRREIFARRPLWFLHPFFTKYGKRQIHRILKGTLGELSLEQCKKDVLITATDTVRSESIYFAAFHPHEGSPYGTYKTIPLRHAIESSISAPTYFAAHGRFIDGGVGIHSNPAYAAAVEALQYSSDKKTKQRSSYENNRIRVLSFGTGAQTGAMEPGEAMAKLGPQWFKYVIDEGIGQAGYQQSFVCQNDLDGAEHRIDFYRYEIFLTREILTKFGDAPDLDPDRLTLDAIQDDSFAVLDKIGRSFGEYLLGNNFFLSCSQPPASGHWKRLGAPPLPPNYLNQILVDFARMDERLG